MSTARIAQAALGVMALHVADDSFLQPASGTSAADHVVSGLVPILVLALAAWAWPRVRPGVAAAGGVALGLFGAALAAEAVFYWGATGLSGDDFFSGLAAGLAGLVLIGVSATVLWTSRRRTGSPAWRWSRRALVATAGAVGVFLLVGPVLFRGRRDPHHARRGPDGPPRRPVRGRHPPHRRRARPPRLVHPLAQRRRGHGLSGPGQGPEARAGTCPRGGTASSWSTVAARAPATATRTASAGRSTRTSGAVSGSSRTAATTWIPSGSPASASPSAGR